VHVAICVERVHNSWIVCAMEITSGLFVVDFADDTQQDSVEGCLKTLILPGSAIETFRRISYHHNRNILCDCDNTDWNLSAVEGMNWTHEWPNDPFNPGSTHRRLRLRVIDGIVNPMTAESDDTDLHFFLWRARVRSDGPGTDPNNSMWVKLVAAIAHEFPFHLENVADDAKSQ